MMDSDAGAAGAPNDAFRDDVLRGLGGKPRAIPARWLYDHTGSGLFEDITDLPEYYPTRTERALLKKHCPEVGACVAGFDHFCAYVDNSIGSANHVSFVVFLLLLALSLLAAIAVSAAAWSDPLWDTYPERYL